MVYQQIRYWVGAAVFSAASLAAVNAQAQEKMRITLDTNPSHVRNRGVEIFAQELKKRVGDRLVVEIFPSGQLFRDRDVPKALRQGAVEMAVPGTWQLDGVEPNAALQALPMFYGVEPAIVNQVMDGKLGEFLNSRLEQRMRVKIPGKWMDLGMQHFFFIDKAVSTHDDMKGLKIRHSGGTANAGRITVFGGNAMLIPFPDLPMAMNQGVVNGVATTYESAWSSKLHEAGLKFGFEDNQFFGQYIPMINQAFWQKLPKDIQEAIVASWDVAAVAQRQMAGKAQLDARDNLVKVGLKVAKPSAADVVAKRKALMGIQDDLIKQMKIDTDAVDAAKAGLRAANVEF